MPNVDRELVINDASTFDPIPNETLAEGHEDIHAVDGKVVQQGYARNQSLQQGGGCCGCDRGGRQIDGKS